MVAYYRAGNNIAYWVLDNSWSQQAGCMQPLHQLLLHLEFSQKDLNDANDHGTFPRGDKTPSKQRANSHSLTFFTIHDTRTRSKPLWAGQSAGTICRPGKIRLNSLLVGASLWDSWLLVAAYWLMRIYRRSLKGITSGGVWPRREFVPFYQPVVDSRSKLERSLAYEALLRWQRGNELIPPGSFIDYAEEQGLILPMTEQLLEQVISDLPLLAPEAVGQRQSGRQPISNNHYCASLLAKQP